MAGKGVPASLFMAVTITLLRAAGHDTSAAPGTTRPIPVLALVNAPLCRDNDAAMFVTLFYGVYRISTGELTYSMRRPPAAVRACAPDGGVETLPRTEGSGLGVSAGARFGTATVPRSSRATGSWCYTDGVTEAMDAQQRMFGAERLEEALRAAAPPQSGRQVMAAAHDAVDAFAAGAEQYDDLTLLGFRRTR